MITIDSFLEGLKAEKQKMLNDLAVLNGRREQLRDDIYRVGSIITEIEREQKKNKEE